MLVSSMSKSGGWHFSMCIGFFHRTLIFKIVKDESSMKFSMCVCAQSFPTLCDSMDCILQASLFMEFSREVYWRGLPFPSPGDLPDPGIEPIYCIAGRCLPLCPMGSP